MAWRAPLVMSGEQPLHVPDEVIGAIRERERNGAIVLPKRRLRNSDRMQIASRPVRRQTRTLRWHGIAQTRPGAAQLLGGERQVRIDRDAVEQI